MVLGALGACQSRETSEISAFTGGDGTLPEELTLVTWNTQKLRNPDIAQDLSNLVSQHSPDLVFLQEVKLDQLELRDMNGHFAESWSYPWPGGPTVGVLTLSHSSPIKAEPLRTEWREFFLTTPKVSLVTEHPLPNGDRLLAVNVHLMNFEIWEPFMLRAQLRDLELVMASHEGPIILAGDFNTWSESRFALVNSVARNLGLEEVTGFPNGRKTGDLDSALLHRVLGIDPKLPLDRIYSRGFRTVSAEVLPNTSSDHRPVLVRLALESVQDEDRSLTHNSDCYRPLIATSTNADELSAQEC